MPTLKVLVTGSTGQQGGAVARRLLNHGHHVRAFTRKPDSPAARALQSLGATIAQGAFDDAAALQRAVDGVDAVFAMSTPFEAGMEKETSHGIALVEAARSAAVGHFVFTSVGGADRKTGIPHFESKWKVEQHLAASGLPHTVLGPVFFMENWLSPWFLPSLKDGAMAIAIPGGRSLQQIALDDLGGFAVHVLENRERFLGRRVDLASDDLSCEEAAAILTRLTGRKITHQPIPIDQIRAWSPDFAKMFDWFNKVGYQTDVAALKKSSPEVGWHTFETWAKERDWSAIKPAGAMGAS